MSDLSITIGKPSWLSFTINYNTYYFKFYAGIHFRGNEIWWFAIDRQDTKPDLNKIKKSLEKRLRRVK